MYARREKIEELLESFHSLRRCTVFRGASSADVPRITPSQWNALMFIEHHKKSTVKEVADALGITSSASTQLVNGLAKNGYVVRNMGAEDRRVVVLSLSKKTKDHVEKMKKISVQKFLEVFKVLSDKEFEQYCILNKKIIRGFSHTR